MRAHLFVPDELMAQVDKAVGKGKRSRFVQEAIKEKLRRSQLEAALAQTAGVLSADDQPEWDTPEDTAAWVRALRRESDRRLVK